MSISATSGRPGGRGLHPDAREVQRRPRQRGLPQPVRERAECNDGLVTHGDLVVDLGFSSGRLAGWLRRGHLVRVQRGVYRVPGSPYTERARHRAALLRANRPAAGGQANKGQAKATKGQAKLGGVSGLGLLAAGDVRLCDHTPFVVVAVGAVLRNVDFDWVSAPLASPDVVTLDGMPCTHPERLLIEAAGVLEEELLLTAADDLRRRRMVVVERMVRRAERLRSHLPGADDVLAMAARGAFEQESPPERSLAGIFLPSDPVPAYQVWLLPHRRVDAVFLEARLVIEVLSDRWHGLSADRAADAARTAELEGELGVKVVEVWPDELDHPSRLRQRLLSARTEQIEGGVPPLRIEDLPSSSRARGSAEAATDRRIGVPGRRD